MIYIKFNLNIPKELHKKFKKHCVDKEITMTNAILECIEKLTKENK